MEHNTWSHSCGMLPQEAAAMQKGTSLSLPGLWYRHDMHKAEPDGGCFTVEACATRALMHYTDSKLIRLDLTLPDLNSNGMQRRCDTG